MTRSPISAEDDTGRAKQFTISLETTPAEADQLALPGLRQRINRPVSHSFTFSKGSPQPDLAKYVFSTPGMRATLNLMEAKARVELERDNGPNLQINPKRLPPTAILRRDLSYLRYVFDELYFGGASDRAEAQSARDEVDTRDLQNLITRFRESTRLLSRRTFASAPVRTEPLRTYTPSEVTASSQGSHVPLEMAQRKTLEPDDWERAHTQLTQFGRRSGLFEDIDIRLLGKRDGDPFQIMVRFNGPQVNLVDVGYGVSQALPIVYQLQNAREYDAFLLQQPEVHLHPRAQAELGSLLARLSRQKQTALYVVETHSDYIIDRVRIAVAEGRLDHKRVTIVYFERREHEVVPVNIYLNDQGELVDPPFGFRSFFLEEHSKLLGL